MASERVILIVDDMEPMLAIASDFLHRKLDNVRAVTFQRPTEALAWLRENDADLILSDNHMGEMDGLTFLDKSRELRPNAIRVLMTAYLDIIATPPQLGARGLHALIRKPWEWNDFGLAMFEILAATPEDRARAAREGPLAYPEGAFAEFAASRRGAAGEGRRAVGPPALSTSRPERHVTDVPVERGEKPSPAIAVSSPTAPRPPPTSAPQLTAPSPPPATPAPPIVIPRVIAAPGHNRLACPHCEEPLDVEVQLPRAMPHATEEDEAKKLLAYLAAHPGVAEQLRRQWVAAARPPPAAQRPPPRRE